jgi:ubiquinone/menaquinone biosynthesis C-methylase UbiE
LEEDSADAYERYLVPAFMKDAAERLIDLVQLQPTERVLDVACGTGIVARRAARRVAPGAVAGLDLNERMLTVARAAAQAEGVEIAWQQGNAEELPFPRGTFDVVLCQQAAQFFPDPVAALREMQRVLVPDGRLGLGVCRPVEHNPVYMLLSEALARHVGAEAGVGMRSPFPPWSTDELRALIAEAGFHDVHVRIEISPTRFPSPAELLRREVASSPLAPVIAGLSPEVRDALVADVNQTLSTYVDDDGVHFALQTYAVTALR